MSQIGCSRKSTRLSLQSIFKGTLDLSANLLGVQYIYIYFLKYQSGKLPYEPGLETTKSVST